MLICNKYISSQSCYILPSEDDILKKGEYNKKKYNRKKIAKIAIVLGVISLFFGAYTILPLGQIGNEFGMATQYFDKTGNTNAVTSDYAYFYFSPLSPSYRNQQKSMINAIYGVGLGFIISGIAALVNKAVGHQTLKGESAVAFVGGFLLGLYGGVSGFTAATEAAAEAGVAMTVTSALVASLMGIVRTYLGAIFAE